MKYLALAAVLLLGLLAYAGSLDAAFAFDDIPSIVRNSSIHDVRAFLAGGWGGRPNRAVGYLTLALNYRFGGTEAIGYHVVNLCIHLLNAGLVYALVVVTFGTPRLRGSALASSARTVALVASALFVAHPLQTQAVTYVVQRLASLATTFYLLAVVLYARWRLGEARQRSRAASVASYVPVLAAAVLAMRTKEIAFTLPFAVCLYEAAFLDGSLRKRLCYLAPVVATLAIIPLTVLGSTRAIGEALSDASAFTRVQTTLSRTTYLLTELPVIVKYLRLLVLPVGQNVDHDVAIEESLSPHVLASAALLLAIVAAAIYLWRAPLRSSRPLDGSARLLAFGALWFFLTLSVESSLIPIVDPMYEHRVYLPSVGFFVAVSTAWTALARRLFSRAPDRGALAAAAVVAMVLAVATFQRNRVWADELSLWSDAVAKSPAKSRPHNNVGAALEERGRGREAEQHFIAAIRLDPGNAEAYYNLGRLYVTQGRYADAIPLLGRAIDLQPRSAGPYANLGAALNRMLRYQDTIALLEGASATVRDSAEAQFNLGVAYAAVGRLERADGQAAVLRRLSPELAAQLERFVRRE